MFRAELPPDSAPYWYQACCCGCCWPLTRLLGYENRYSSAFPDNGPESNALSSSPYQAPSPASRGPSQTAQAPQRVDPEGSALLTKGGTSSAGAQESDTPDVAYPRAGLEDARLHRRIQSAEQITRLAEAKAGDSPKVPKLGSGLKLALDDEDVCPTCLEPYSDDNPKILTQCHHHFHLACIYEWLERSQTCPICSRQMSFDEFM